MSPNSQTLQARIATVEREATTSDYVRAELEQKIRRRDQRVKELNQAIDTLAQVEDNLRGQVRELKDKVRRLETFRENVALSLEGLET